MEYLKTHIMNEENLIIIPFHKHSAEEILKIKQDVILDMHHIPKHLRQPLIDKMSKVEKEKFEQDKTRKLLVVDTSDIIAVFNVLYKAGYNVGFEKGSKQYVLQAC